VSSGQAITASSGSLGRRLLLGSALLVVALSSAFVVLYTVRELRRVEEALTTRGEDLARHLARLGRLGVLAADPSALQPPAEAVLGSPGVVAVRYLDARGATLLERRSAPLSEAPRRFSAAVEAAVADDEGLDLYATAPARQTVVGRAEVSLDGGGARARARDAMLGGGLLMVVFLGAGLLGAFAVARSVLRPVAALTEGVRLVSRGELDHRLPEAGPAEVAELARAYNEMALALDLRTTELARQRRDAEEFVYIASHDLQSPLISIQGFADRLAGRRGPEMSDEQLRWLSRVRANVEHMGVLIRGLLDLSRLNTRRNPEERIASRDLVERALRPLADGLEARGVDLVLGEGEWPELEGDVPRLQALFGNLIDNAAKYLGEDNADPRIEVGCEPGDEVHTFFVRDNGVGIASEHLDRVFRPLERLKTVDAHGIGMGLSLVRKIVETHGGEIGVSSRLGEGTTFTVSLPTVGGTGTP